MQKPEETPTGSVKQLLFILVIWLVILTLSQFMRGSSST